SPILDEVFLDPGRHVVKAQIHGFEPAWTTVEMVAGSALSIDLAPAPIAQKPVVILAPTAPPRPDPLPPAPPPQRSFAPRPVGIAAIGVGVGVGAGATILSNASSQGADTLRAELAKLGTDACNPKSLFYKLNQEACVQLGKLQDMEATSRSVAIVSFT